MGRGRDGLLESAELFWISTVRADGRPHVTPLPAVWHDNALHFCTGAGEQKGVNLTRNASCALTTGTNAWKSGLDVVVEGRAERVSDDAQLRRLADLWSSKYDGDWEFDVRDGAFHHEGGQASSSGSRRRRSWRSPKATCQTKFTAHSILTRRLSREALHSGRAPVSTATSARQPEYRAAPCSTSGTPGAASF